MPEYNPSRTLRTKIKEDEITRRVKEVFTISQDEITFEPHDIIPLGFQLMCIVGSSGSGKSILLNEYGSETKPEWDDRPICSHFDSYEEAEERLLAVGLSSIPAWLLPYHLLSTGQQYRARVARSLKDHAVFDEFTSYLDRSTAKGLAVSISRYIKKKNLTGIVVCTPNHDIVPYLEADVVYDTDLRSRDKKELNNPVLRIL